MLSYLENLECVHGRPRPTKPQRSNAHLVDFVSLASVNPLLKSVLEQVDAGEDLELEIEEFVSAGGELGFMALALGWATLGRTMSSTKARLRKRPLRAAQGGVRAIRKIIRQLARQNREIPNSWLWWGWPDFPSGAAPWDIEDQVWAAREKRLQELAATRADKRPWGRPADFRRYFLTGALAPYMERQGVGEKKKDGSFGAQEWRNGWWPGFLGQLEGGRKIKYFERWRDTRAFDPQKEESFEYILRGASVYWAWIRRRRRVSKQSRSVLEAFLKKLPLKRFGYDQGRAVARVEAWSRILGPGELRDALR